MNARDELAALIDSQPTPEYAADAILAAGWVPGSRLALVRDSVRDVSQSLRAERDRLAATVDRVRWLAEAPDPHNPNAYQHYAVPIEGEPGGGIEVVMGVLVDNLRAALDADQAPPTTTEETP